MSTQPIFKVGADGQVKFNLKDIRKIFNKNGKEIQAHQIRKGDQIQAHVVGVSVATSSGVLSPVIDLHVLQS